MLNPLRSFFILPFLLSHLLLLPLLTNATSLTISVPSNLRLLPPSTRAILTTTGKVHKTTVTRWNTFYLQQITYPATYLLDIACRDYDFERLRVEVDEEGNLEVWNRWYGGGEKVVEGGVDVKLEVRVLRNRDYYEERPGCMCLSLSLLHDVLVRTERKFEWNRALILKWGHSLPTESFEKPNDFDRRGGIGLCVRDAISVG